jgi:hypothetical protein
MTLRVVFRPAARAEFDGAALWYEDRRLGLGAEFVMEIDRAVELASGHPEDFRRSLPKFDASAFAAFRTPSSIELNQTKSSSWPSFMHAAIPPSGRDAYDFSSAERLA